MISAKQFQNSLAQSWARQAMLTNWAYAHEVGINILTQWEERYENVSPPSEISRLARILIWIGPRIKLRRLNSLQYEIRCLVAEDSLFINDL